MSSDVSLDEFVEAIAVILEIEPKNLVRAKLKEVEAFDSLGLIQIAITVEDLFGVQVSSEDLLGFENISEMYRSVVMRALPGVGD